jgi:hypothetical protein
MTPELSFYTNEELITELLRRQTFAGIVLRPNGPLEEIEKDPYIQFDMTWSTRLPDKTVISLLELASERLKGKK